MNKTTSAFAIRHVVHRYILWMKDYFNSSAVLLNILYSSMYEKFISDE